MEVKTAIAINQLSGNKQIKFENMMFFINQWIVFTIQPFLVKVVQSALKITVYVPSCVMKSSVGMDFHSMLWNFHSFISNHRFACCLGSGKSYTMMGSQDHKGIIPRLCDSLFDLIAKQQSSELMYKVEVSYMEIYNEKVQHLNRVF